MDPAGSQSSQQRWQLIFRSLSCSKNAKLFSFYLKTLRKSHNIIAQVIKSFLLSAFMLGRFFMCSTIQKSQIEYHETDRSNQTFFWFGAWSRTLRTQEGEKWWSINKVCVWVCVLMQTILRNRHAQSCDLGQIKFNLRVLPQSNLLITIFRRSNSFLRFQIVTKL